VYFGDPNLDRVMIAMIAMLAEVSAVRERLATHERLGDLGQTITTSAVEGARIEGDARAGREERESALLHRVLRVFLEEGVLSAEELARLGTKP
jgi:hypothetical protein